VSGAYNRRRASRKAGTLLASASSSLLWQVFLPLPFIVVADFVVAVFVVANSHSNKLLFVAVLLFASRYSPFAAVHHRG
jgi:predicted membrane protein